MPLFGRNKKTDAIKVDGDGESDANDSALFSIRGHEAVPPVEQEPFFPSSDADSASALAQQQQQDLYDAKYAIPCSITGLMAAASGGALGFVFGFGSRVVRGASPLSATAAAPSSRVAAALADGRSSAASFAGFGGVYSAAACAVSRIRDVEHDPLNGAIAGCVTGAALGWKGGPASAAQSCAMLGGFSYFIDRMQGGQVAQAAVEESEGGGGDETGRERRRRRPRPQQQQQRSSASSRGDDASEATTTCGGSRRRRGSGSRPCCAVGGPLGAALASALPFNDDRIGDDDPLSLLVGPGVKRAASEAVRRLSGAVRGAAEERVRRARWEW